MLPIRERLNSEIKIRIEENNNQKQGKYSESLVKPKSLAEALRVAKYEPKRIWCKKAECEEPDYEDEWSRVQRMRKEGDPKCLGGRFTKYSTARRSSGEYKKGLSNSKRKIK